MVTLFVPFRNEHIDILDNFAFLNLFDEHKTKILEKKKQFMKKE